MIIRPVVTLAFGVSGPMHLLFLLTACSPGDTIGRREPGDTGSELVPGDTAATDPGDSGDTGDPGDQPATPTAPVLINLECPGPIPDAASIPCDIVAAWPDGTAEVAGVANLSRRGRSSSGFPKPQYKVEFVDDAGEDLPVRLFDLGRESDWVLNGMWIDRAMIRNKFAWDLFNALSEAPDHAPESVYAELTLDGAYLGVFLLNQMIDRDASRLDFAADDGTGARFIVSGDEVGLRSDVQYASWKIDYPPESDQTAAVRSGITASLGDWEAAIRGAGDPFEFMDLDSFVRFVLIEEFTKNNDAYFLSHRVWRGDDGKLRMVPWDLDLTLGQPNYNENWRTDTWLAYRSELITGSTSRAFSDRFAEMWRTAREGELATDAVIARIAAQRVTLGDAVARNWETWDISTVDFGGELYVVATPEEEYERVDAWVRARLEWMDANVARF